MGARNGSQRVQPPSDPARRSQNVLPGKGLPTRLSPTVTDTPEFPDTEEVTGSNPVRPTSTNARLRPFLLGSVRHRRVMVPRLRLHDLVVSVRGEVGIPLSCPVALVAEERLDVIQGHPVDHQPAGRGMAHDPRREPADARGGLGPPRPSRSSTTRTGHRRPWPREAAGCPARRASGPPSPLPPPSASGRKRS
jgi:hypothetical protein